MSHRKPTNNHTAKQLNQPTDTHTSSHDSNMIHTLCLYQRHQHTHAYVDGHHCAVYVLLSANRQATLVADDEEHDIPSTTAQWLHFQESHLHFLTEERFEKAYDLAKNDANGVAPKTAIPNLWFVCDKSTQIACKHCQKRETNVFWHDNSMLLIVESGP